MADVKHRERRAAAASIRQAQRVDEGKRLRDGRGGKTLRQCMMGKRGWRVWDGEYGA